MNIAVAIMIVAGVFGADDGDNAYVKPAPNEAQVLLGSQRVTAGDGRSNGSKPKAAAAKKPAWRPPLLCRVDPETPNYGCRNVPPEEAPDAAELTEGDIVRAVREIGLPSLTVQIQPGEETLVNVETIFYTRPRPFERSVTLLGFDVDLVATPVRYTWVHDDGTVSTTSRPGRPYPAMDVTHRYREPADDVHPRVDVTYRVRYRVDGGAWQTIGQTLQASGPAAELDVREAAPVLTKP